MNYAPNSSGYTEGLAYPGAFHRHNPVTEGVPPVVNSRGFITHAYSNSWRNADWEAVEASTYYHTNQSLPYQYPYGPMIYPLGYDYPYPATVPGILNISLVPGVTNYLYEYRTNWLHIGRPLLQWNTYMYFRPFEGTNHSQIEIPPWVSTSNWLSARVLVPESNYWDLAVSSLHLSDTTSLLITNFDYGTGYTQAVLDLHLYPEVGDLSFFLPCTFRKTNGLPWVTYVHPYDNPGTNISDGGLD